MKLTFLPKEYTPYTPSEPINRPSLKGRRECAVAARDKHIPQRLTKRFHQAAYNGKVKPVMVMHEGIPLTKFQAVATSSQVARNSKHICYAHNEMHAKHLLRDVVSYAYSLEVVQNN